MIELRDGEKHLVQVAACQNPESVLALETVRRIIPWSQREVYTYQALFLHTLIKTFNPQSILEIGTAYGYTAAIMAEATGSPIITLNPNEEEFEQARENLEHWENVEPIKTKSWTYLAETVGKFDFIFVDGDHAKVRRDMPWWNRLRSKGLFLFHDYSPHGSGRPTPTVYKVVNNFADYLGRDPDVLIVDDEDVGMAGFVRQPTDPDYQ